MFGTITGPVMEPISISTAGDNILIAGTSDQWIYVRQLFLVADGGNNTVTVKSGSDTKSIVPLLDDTGFIIENTAPDYPYLFAVPPGEDLILNLSSATSVKGHIVYGFRK